MSYLIFAHPDCLCCQRLTQIDNQYNPYHVAHLVGGELVVSDDFIENPKFIFILATHKERLSDLNSDERRDVMRSLAQIDEYIWAEMTPINVHYKLLGDTVKHLHWHITPIFKPPTSEFYADNHKRFWKRYWVDRKED